MRSIGQIPYVSEEDTMDLLNQFRGNHYESEFKGQLNSEIVEEISSVEQRPNWSDSLPGCEQTTCDSEQDYEEIIPRKPRPRSKKTKR
jgi:hypothetical protein